MKQLIKPLTGLVFCMISMAFVANATANATYKICKAYLITDNDTVYNKVDVTAIPPGGISGFLQFISDNIRYPVEDRKNGIQGRVVVSFVVEKDGRLSTIKVKRTPSVSLGNEAIRVVKLSSNWVPGKLKGNVVRT